MAELIKKFKDNKVERISFERGVTQDELVALMANLARLGSKAGRRRQGPVERAHPRRTPQERGRARSRTASRATSRQSARCIRTRCNRRRCAWQSAEIEGIPDAPAALRDRRGAGRRRDAEPHRADGADGDAQLRQLHVHPHGERVDPRRWRRRARSGSTAAAARVRPVGADARHRQGAHAEGDSQQARQADRRRVRHHAAARRGRRGDPPAHARDADPRADRGVRTPPASRRQRLSPHRQARTR